MIESADGVYCCCTRSRERDACRAEIEVSMDPRDSETVLQSALAELISMFLNF